MGDLQDEARRLLDGITPGPWEWKRLTWLRGAVQEGGRRTQILTLDDAATDPTSADAELIEEAPRLVEALLAALDDRDAALVAAEAEQRRLREAIAAIEAVHQPIPEDPSFCSACTTSWPCETFRLVKASLADALGSVPAVPTDAPEPDPGGLAFAEALSDYADRHGVDISRPSWVTPSLTPSAAAVPTGPAAPPDTVAMVADLRDRLREAWRRPTEDEDPSPGDWRVVDTDARPERVVYLRPASLPPAVPLSVEEASDACAFCLDVECDGVACIARLDPDDPDDLAEVERLQALLRSGRVTAGSGGRR